MLFQERTHIGKGEFFPGELFPEESKTVVHFQGHGFRNVHHQHIAARAAVELAKGFDEPETVSFINGILGAFMRDNDSGAEEK